MYVQEAKLDILDAIESSVARDSEPKASVYGKETKLDVLDAIESSMAQESRGHLFTLTAPSWNASH